MTLKHKHKFASIILAAGNGTRMRSHIPKVMHKLVGEPMIQHVVNTVGALTPEHTVIVIAPHMDKVREAVTRQSPSCLFATQDEQKGTGHAVSCAMDALTSYSGVVLVLYGDTPLITSETLSSLLSQHVENNATISLLGMRPEPPTGYGRLVMKAPPFVERIVECKDANSEEKKIPFAWAGMMAFDAEFLRKDLKELTPSAATGEYYLTELVELATTQQLKTLMVEINVQEAMGVNDRVQLAQAEKIIQQRLRIKAMQEGATLIDPESVYLSLDTALGRDVVIYPHVVFGPKVKVADSAQIRSFSHLEGAEVMSHAIIGPYARLRPGSVIGEGAHVGNFVELKKTTLGNGSKANHLSYIGDTEVGENVNIGAGTITCNYDGTHKYNTVIEDRAFIGSNTSLVAPVTIGRGAVVGAGSVITENVSNEELAIARARQVNKIKKSQKKA